MGENIRVAPKPQIAIVGGGIVSMMLTLVLIKQKIPVRVYEQASGFREVGAGIAFSACARHCSRYQSLNLALHYSLSHFRIQASEELDSNT